MRGSKKRSAALAGIGLQAGRQGSSQARVTASKFTDGMKERLRELVRTRAPEADVVSYLRSIVRRTSERRQQELVLVTLVEGPCEPDSFIAEENARCGGASLRIVKPTSECPAQTSPPALVLGAARNWPLDVHVSSGRLLLEQYLGRLLLA